MDNVFEFLDSTGLSYRVVEHQAVFRVGEEPPELHGLPTTKNLLLKNTKNDQVYMVVMVGEKKLNILLLAEELQTSKNKLRFLRYDEVEPAVGVGPGHVSIFNLLDKKTKDIRVVFDKELLRLPEIGFHPNINTSSVFLNPADALRLLTLAGKETLVTEL